mmetsp:Transcript_153847/g.493411  ORF Transcript_153847/g.493411 Transcript_153847/m.493411 type:complete len:205 (-) Transcript_153847:78-692(-)
MRISFSNCSLYLRSSLLFWSIATSLTAITCPLVRSMAWKTTPIAPRPIVSPRTHFLRAPRTASGELIVMSAQEPVMSNCSSSPSSNCKPARFPEGPLLGAKGLGVWMVFEDEANILMVPSKSISSSISSSVLSPSSQPSSSRMIVKRPDLAGPAGSGDALLPTAPPPPLAPPKPAEGKGGMPRGTATQPRPPPAGGAMPALRGG